MKVKLFLGILFLGVLVLAAGGFTVRRSRRALGNVFGGRVVPVPAGASAARPAYA